MASGGECDFCGNKSFMPYKCRYCSGRFCPDHRLPENHNCEGLRRVREKPQWKDYATQVRKREASREASKHHERWDREEDARGTGFLRGPPLPRTSSWYPTQGVEAMKRNMISVLGIALVAALLIRFLLL